jgi:hypothetical protein
MLQKLDRHPPLVGPRRRCLVTRDAGGLLEKFGDMHIPPKRPGREKVGSMDRRQDTAARCDAMPRSAQRGDP